MSDHRQQKKPQRSEPSQSSIERAAAAFKAARLSANLTQDQVADALKITRERVIRLESGRVSNLPSLIYIKGYMREFERLLNLEPKSVEQLFVDAYAESQKNDGRPGLKPVRSDEFTSAGQKLSIFLHANPSHILTAVLLVALAGIAGAALWYFL